MAASGGVDGPVGVGQHQDDVDEGQGQGGLPEEVGHPQVDVAQTDHDHQRRDGQWQQAQEVHRPLGPRRPQPDPDHGGHKDQKHQPHGEGCQQQGDDDRGVELLVLAEVLPRLQGPAALDQVARAEVGHRVEREHEVEPEERQQDSSGRTRPRARTAGHRSHLDVRRTRSGVGHHHDGDHDDHLQRQRVGEAGLAEHDLTGERRPDQQRQDRGALVDQGGGSRVGRERVGEQKQQRTEEGGSQQGDGHVPPVLPRRGSEVDRGLPPLLAQTLQRREEHDHHERDLEVDVHDDQTGEAVQPADARQVPAEVLRWPTT